MQQKALGAHEVTNTEVAMHQSGQHSGKQANMDCFSTHHFWEAYPGPGGPMVLKALALSMVFFLVAFMALEQWKKTSKWRTLV